MLSAINQQFIKAAENNRLDELKNLLIQGADINVDNDIALIWSAHNGLLKIVKFLVMPDLGSATIIHGANIHTNDDAALRYSARFGHLEIVKFLVTKGANIHANNEHALRDSAHGGHFEIVKCLIAKGADIHVNDDEIFKIATKNKNKPILMLLNAFLTEEKLLVAALDSMPLVAVVGVMPVLPALGSVALVVASDSTVASTWVGGTSAGMPKTQQVKLKKSVRSKI